MEDIPLIDLQPQFENHAKETEIVKQIRDACENNGFFAVRGHGIPEIVIEHCWRVSHDFFALAEEEKQKVKMPFAGYPYGFCGNGSRNTFALTWAKRASGFKGKLFCRPK